MSKTGMAEKTARVGFRWRPETKAALEKAAKSEDRTASYVAERAVSEWLTRRGFLKKGIRRGV